MRTPELVSKELQLVVEKLPPAPQLGCSGALDTWVYFSDTVSCSCCFIREKTRACKIEFPRIGG